MEATAEADWLQEVRVALGEKVAEIRRLGEAQGDKGLLQARGAAYALLGGATPEWVANQEVHHREEKDALRGNPGGQATAEGAEGEIAGEEGRLPAE